MNKIYITETAKVFNLSGEGKAFPASLKAIEHLGNEGSELDVLVVAKDGVESIVHVDEALEQKLYTPASDVNYFHDNFVGVLTHDMATTTVNERNIQAIKDSGSTRVEQFFNHNGKYLKFMNPEHQQDLKNMCLHSANESLAKI